MINDNFYFKSKDEKNGFEVRICTLKSKKIAPKGLNYTKFIDFIGLDDGYPFSDGQKIPSRPLSELRKSSSELRKLPSELRELPSELRELPSELRESSSELRKLPSERFWAVFYHLITITSFL